MAIVLLITASCVVLSVAVHLGVLRLLWLAVRARPAASREWVTAALVLGCLAGHLIEITVFAFGFFLAAALDGDAQTALGWLPNGRLEVWYYSAAFYTSVGADRPPSAGLRMFAVVEALSGLILITWTASFLFLVMQRTWDPDPADTSPRG